MIRIPERIRIELQTADCALLLVVILALGLRLAYFTGLHFSDDPDYAMRAFNLLSGREHLYTDNNGLRIGTWYPAALGYAIFGINDFGLVVYPLIMSLVAVVTIDRLGRALFDRRAGLLAALLLAVYPLDLELSTRLLPDALLAAWSLVAMFFLFRADLAQERSRSLALAAPWSYLLSGAALGWCVAVNMSSVVLLVFVALYFMCSAIWLWPSRPPGRASSWLLLVCCRRYVILLAGLLVVTGLEACLYRAEFGAFLVKYTNTLSHYNLENRSFFQDLWLYPENMFFVRRGWRFELPPPQYRPYGFFFFAALPCLVYGVVRGGRRFWTIALWATTVWGYLQWGTMSLTSWNLLHRLDRHLELVTPPMILIMACVLSRLMNKRSGRLLAGATLAALIATSLQTADARHSENMHHLALMKPVHHVLEAFRPAHVFMDTQRNAYQQFLDRYQDRGRIYHDINLVSHEPPEGSIALVGSDSVYPARTEGGIDPQRPPAEWQALTTIEVNDGWGPARTLRAYRLTPMQTPAVDLSRVSDVDRHLREAYPERVKPDTRVMFSWEGVVDGVERILIRGPSASNEHLAFEPPREVRWRSYAPIVQPDAWRYDAIKDVGRGSVTIVEQPSPDNDSALVVEVTDSPPGAARYRWFIVARPRDTALR